VTDRPSAAERLEVEGPGWRVLLAGLRRPRHFIDRFVARILADRILTYAAAMSYYLFFALFPLLIFVLAFVSVLPLAGLENWIVSLTVSRLPEQAARLVERTIRGILAQERGGLLSLGALLALWGGSSAFASIMDGLNAAYRVEDSRPWWRVRLEAIALTLGLSVFMIIAFVLAVFGGPLLRLVTGALGPFGTFVVVVLRWAIVLGTITFVVAAVYYFAPDVEQRWRWVTPGSLLFMVTFGGVSAGFSYYVGRFADYDKTYGSLGAVIILLLWMYLLSIFLLLGAELNALLEHESPAGKAPGQKELPPGEVQIERVRAAEQRARA
jgi:membrane protein